MPRVSILALAALLLVPGLAHADSAPEFDELMACAGKAVDEPCSVDVPEPFNGTCKNIPCESSPQMTCLTCVDPEAETTAGGTAGEGTAGAPTTGSPTTGGSSGSGGGSGSTAGGSTGDGPSDSKGGCSCRGDSAPASGLLMVLGAVLLRRRRR